MKSMKKICSLIILFCSFAFSGIAGEPCGLAVRNGGNPGQMPGFSSVVRLGTTFNEQYATTSEPIGQGGLTYLYTVVSTQSLFINYLLTCTANNPAGTVPGTGSILYSYIAQIDCSATV